MEHAVFICPWTSFEPQDYAQTRVSKELWMAWKARCEVVYDHKGCEHHFRLQNLMQMSMELGVVLIIRLGLLVLQQILAIM
ncbi:hypothetical protein M0R45_006020 [Rubus argutus]|uniref:Uncharacterized protein n=1 Tax=Rubus argutus TaxID=59490 RepID=A0AAW1YPJ6_RUBAR